MTRRSPARRTRTPADPLARFEARCLAAFEKHPTEAEALKASLLAVGELKFLTALGNSDDVTALRCGLGLKAVERAHKATLAAA